MKKRLSQKNESWGKRYWLPLAGMLILTLSFAAMSSIWKNVQDMEAKRYREHDELARSIGETAKTFLVSRQYDYFLEVLRLLQKTSFINHVKMMIEGRVVLNSGLSPAPERRGSRSKVTLAWFPSTHQVRKTLDYQNGKRAEMLITFSLEEFRKPKLYILAAFAVMLILFNLLGMGGIWIYCLSPEVGVGGKD